MTNYVKQFYYIWASLGLICADYSYISPTFASPFKSAPSQH